MLEFLDIIEEYDELASYIVRDSGESELTFTERIVIPEIFLVLNIVLAGIYLILMPFLKKPKAHIVIGRIGCVIELFSLFLIFTTVNKFSSAFREVFDLEHSVFSFGPGLWMMLVMGILGLFVFSTIAKSAYEKKKAAENRMSYEAYSA